MTKSKSRNERKKDAKKLEDITANVQLCLTEMKEQGKTLAEIMPHCKAKESFMYRTWKEVEAGKPITSIVYGKAGHKLLFTNVQELEMADEAVRRYNLGSGFSAKRFAQYVCAYAKMKSKPFQIMTKWMHFRCY